MQERSPSARAWLLALLACIAPAVAADAAQILLSTTADATLAGLTFRNGDVVLYDDVAGTATLVFDEDVFTADETIDSFFVLPNGHFVLSTGGSATLGGLSFLDGDAISYDPVNDVSTLLFSESLFTSGANLDGFQVLPNGNFLLTTAEAETLAGLVFQNGDLVEYDPVGGTASIFLDEDAVFLGNEDIGGFHLMDDGRIAFSTLGDATLTVSGVTMSDGDIVVYDPSDGSAFVLFDESSYAADSDTDAVFVQLVPEPGTAALLALGLCGLAGRRRAARRR